MGTKYYKKRRKRKTKKYFRMFLLLAVLISILALIFYTTMIFFKVNKVTVVTDTKYTNQQILDIANINQGDSIIFLNNFNIANQILEKLPYVSSVKIKRNYPDEVIIEAAKAVELATVYHQNKYFLLDENLKILDVIDVETAKNHKRIFGIEMLEYKVGDTVDLSLDNRAQSIKKLVEGLKKYEKFANTTEIYVEKNYDIRVLLDGKYEIYFGTTEDLDHKFKFLEEVLKKLSPSDTGIIDLSDKTTARFIPTVITPKEFINPQQQESTPVDDGQKQNTEPTGE